jgi:hypothetical protein
MPGGEKFNIYFTERIKNQVKLFSGMLLIETNVFVSHGKYLNLFQLQGAEFLLNTSKKDGKFTQNFSFDSEIKFMFKRSEQTNKRGPKSEDYSVGILLENGDFHLVMPASKKSNTVWVSKKYGEAGIDASCTGPEFPENTKVIKFQADK